MIVVLPMYLCVYVYTSFCLVQSWIQVYNKNNTDPVEKEHVQGFSYLLVSIYSNLICNLRTFWSFLDNGHYNVHTYN